MGIRDGPTALRSPWQNDYFERLIGSIRLECLNYILLFGKQHHYQVMTGYARYYNSARTHLILEKNSPNEWPIRDAGTIKLNKYLGGLHHEYARV